MNATPVLPRRAEAGAEGWTADRVDLLTKLWADGLSASQIAKQLGGVSRSSVIGKVHRLALPGRQRAAAPGAQPRPPRPKKAPGSSTAASPIYYGDPRTSPLQKKLDVINANERVRATARQAALDAPLATFDEVEGEPGCATLLTLGSFMCKWPIGDPQSPSFSFCGRRRDGDPSYCTEHKKLAYEPAKEKKKTSANELARSLRKFI